MHIDQLSSTTHSQTLAIAVILQQFVVLIKEWD